MRSDQYTFRKVEAKRRYVDVALQLLQAIGSDSFRTGDRLPPDRDLADMMGVSRPTAREAILLLELIGVIEVRPGDGTYIAHDGGTTGVLAGLLADSAFPMPAYEVLEARILIEPPAAVLASQRMDADEITDLRAVIEKAADRHEDPRDLATFIELGLQFHISLARGCHNANIAEYCERLVSIEQHPLWTILNARALQSIEARRAQVEEHRAILAAVVAGDVPLVEELTRAHLEHLRQAVEDIIIDHQPTEKRSPPSGSAREEET